MNDEHRIGFALASGRTRRGIEIMQAVIEDGLAGNMHVTDPAQLERNRLALEAKLTALGGSHDGAIEAMQELMHQTYFSLQAYAGGRADQAHRRQEDAYVLGGLAVLNALMKTIGDMGPDDEDRDRCELDVLAVQALLRNPHAVVRDLQYLTSRCFNLLHRFATLEEIPCQCDQHPIDEHEGRR